MYCPIARKGRANDGEEKFFTIASTIDLSLRSGFRGAARTPHKRLGSVDFSLK
jgi:hypothetical protein